MSKTKKYYYKCDCGLKFSPSEFPRHLTSCSWPYEALKPISKKEFNAED